MKYLWMLLLFLLTVYPPLELTRVIIINELIVKAHPQYSAFDYCTEIAFIWACYLAALVIVWRVVKVRA
jgi:hypothetical protein